MRNRVCVDIDDTYSSSVLDLWRRQHATLNLRHLITDVDSECLQVMVVVEIGSAHLHSKKVKSVSVRVRGCMLPLHHEPVINKVRLINR